MFEVLEDRLMRTAFDANNLAEPGALVQRLYENGVRSTEERVRVEGKAACHVDRPPFGGRWEALSG